MMAVSLVQLFSYQVVIIKLACKYVSNVLWELRFITPISPH